MEVYTAEPASPAASPAASPSSPASSPGLAPTASAPTPTAPTAPTPYLRQGAQRVMAQRASRSTGYSAMHILRLVQQLPDGLQGHALRRAANRLCKISEARCYSDEELAEAIIDIIYNDSSTAAHAHNLSMGASTLRRHTSAAKTYVSTMPARAQRNGVKAFVRTLRGKGRPPVFWPDEERLIVSKFGEQDNVGYGITRPQMGAMLHDLGRQLDVPVAGSRSMVDKMINRVNAAAGVSGASAAGFRKTSNISANRAAAHTIEKFETMFKTYDDLVQKFISEGRIPGPDFPPDCLLNTDEITSEDGRFQRTLQMNGGGGSHRVRTGERLPFHGSGVITTTASGTVSMRASGTVVSGGTASAFHALNLHHGRDAMISHVTQSGTMDEAGWLKVAVGVAVAFNKIEWQCDREWNDQLIDERMGAFETRPLIWLLDAHFSHKSPDALEYCRDHDIWVVFSAAGGSSTDQANDCGTNCAAQQLFGEEVAEWRLRFPGLPFTIPDWNLCFTAMMMRLAEKHNVIRASYKKTGWYPFTGTKAENYQHLHMSVIGDVENGIKHLKSTRSDGEQATTKMLKPRTGDYCTLIRAYDGSKDLLVRTKTVEWLEKSFVAPAHEIKRKYEEIVGSKKAKLDGSDYLAATNTACGAWGTAEHFINACREQARKKQARAEEKAAKKIEKAAAAAQAAAEHVSTARRVRADLEAGNLVLEKTDGPQPQPRVITVAELKSLIIASGRSVPVGRKEVLVRLVRTLLAVDADADATATAT